MKKVVITTGDTDGIGLEITAKALLKLKIPRSIQIIYWRSSGAQNNLIEKLRKRFSPATYSKYSAALRSNSRVVEIISDKNPALWFEESVRSWKSIDAIVTAPLSKLTIKKSGLKDAGHTDILRRLTKKPVMMAFWGTQFSLMLVTDHVAYKNVPGHINRKKIFDAILDCDKFLKKYKNRGRIGVLGLNPHAGEIKKLGDEERILIAPAIRAAKARGIKVYGPLVPDVCFQPQNIKKHSMYVAMYHDQGLIPFKIYHKYNRGIQFSINLPFIRTSVDHGTAKDIFGKNKADPSSMLMAIQKAFEWC